MRTHGTWIVASALLVALAAVPQSAEAAGFGRSGKSGKSGRSGSSSSSGSSSGNSSSGSSSSGSTSSPSRSSGGGYGRTPDGGGSSRPNGSGQSSGGYRVNSYPTASGGYRHHGRGYDYSPGYRVGVGVGVGYYDYYNDPYYYPYYTGWGVYPYGYYARGYYPYWGAPPPTEENPSPRPFTVSLYGGAMGSSLGLAPHASLGIDGERWGFNLKGTLLGNPDPNFPGYTDAMPMFSTHVAYSVISNPHARVRVEGGLSGVVAPDLTYYGPDLGVSGQLAIAGPLALQGSLHVTPFPATIFDATAGVALNFGGLGVLAGWRTLTLDDRGGNPIGDGGSLRFNGPTVSIGAIY